MVAVVGNEALRFDSVPGAPNAGVLDAPNMLGVELVDAPKLNAMFTDSSCYKCFSKVSMAFGCHILFHACKQCSVQRFLLHIIQSLWHALAPITDTLVHAKAGQIIDDSIIRLAQSFTRAVKFLS